MPAFEFAHLTLFLSSMALCLINADAVACLADVDESGYLEASDLLSSKIQGSVCEGVGRDSSK
jgi:hypothetical protein